MVASLTSGDEEVQDENVPRILQPKPVASIIGKLAKNWADEMQNVEKPINERKILDNEKRRVIFQFHASLFVLGVL